MEPQPEKSTKADQTSQEQGVKPQPSSSEPAVKDEVAVAQPEPKKQKREGEDSSDEQEDETKNVETGEKKKKKKKKNKKKKAAKQPEQSLIPVVEDIPIEELTAETQTNDRFRCLGGWPTPAKFKFPNNQFEGYPANEVSEYRVPRVKSE